MMIPMAMIKRLRQRSAAIPKGIASAPDQHHRPANNAEFRFRHAHEIFQVDDHIRKGYLHPDAGDHNEEQ